MDNPRVRRLCVAVDLRHYHELDAVDQHHAQSGLMEVLDAAGTRTDVPRLDWHRQEKGDGELALLPPGIDEVSFAQAFVAGLRGALHEHNRRKRPHLRLRVAMHQGLTWIAAAGYAGGAVVTVSRLCDAPQIKKIMDDRPAADLVLVLSNDLYEDLIGDDGVDLNRAAFRRLRIEMPVKDFYADAWVHVPSESAQPATAESTQPATASSVQEPDPADAGPVGTEPAIAPGGVTNNVTRNLIGGSVQAGGHGATFNIGGDRGSR
jgi:hypothetical protein